MTERTSYEPGTPSWVDLRAPTSTRRKRFYGGLFGWEVEDAGPVEETGGYAMFTLNGRNVAGVGPVMDESQPPVDRPTSPPTTPTASAARATEAGGERPGRADGRDGGRAAWPSSRTPRAG